MQISYAAAANSVPKQLLIRLVESLTGVKRIERLLEQRHQYFEEGYDVWATALELLNLRIEQNGFPLEQIPSTGPLIFVCNHPFGLPDGIIACHLAHQVRTDFRLLAIDLLHQVPELKQWVLPVDFAPTPKAKETNLQSRSEAIRILKEGGAILLFPAGEVATAPYVLGKAIESEWSTFLGRMVLTTNAQVVPICFSGQNTWMFHLASRISETVRLALLVRETNNLIGKKVSVTVGQPIGNEQLRNWGDRRELVKSLQSLTLGLRQKQ